MNVFRLLITRKIDRALLTAIEKNEISVTEKDFIQIVPVTAKTDMPPARSVVIFTSKNAVDAVSQLNGEDDHATWKIFCLSGTTLDYVKKYFSRSDIAGVATDATELAGKIIDTCDAKELTFFCGDKRMDTLPAILKKAGYQVNEKVVYKTILTPVTIDQQFDGVGFFSPSAVQSFFSMNRPGKDIVFFSVGDTTSAEIKKYADNKILTAAHPSADELMNAVVRFSKERGIKN